jgi:periplasmic protein CpxP/Spy
MKSIILSICLIVAGSYSFAQDKKMKKTHEERAEFATSKLEKEITLSKEQRDKIYAINLSTAQKNQEIHNKKELTEEQKKEQLKASNKNRYQLVVNELTQEQKKILKEKRKSKKEKID